MCECRVHWPCRTRLRPGQPATACTHCDSSAEADRASSGTAGAQLASHTCVEVALEGGVLVALHLRARLHGSARAGEGAMVSSGHVQCSSSSRWHLSCSRDWQRICVLICTCYRQHSYPAIARDCSGRASPTTSACGLVQPTAGSTPARPLHLRRGPPFRHLRPPSRHLQQATADGWLAPKHGKHTTTASFAHHARTTPL